MFIAFVSCDEKIEVEKVEEIEMVKLTNFRSSYVHKNIEYDWENNTKVLINGENIILPWYNGAPASLPQHIFTDYKKSDGWVMIYNFITDDNVNMSNRYVFVFYNIFRGLMRIYYYNTLFPSQAETSFAQFTIHDEDTRLFNASTPNRACLPMDQVGNNVVYTTGISSTPVSGFYYGWNLFEIEISYDQFLKNKSVSMSISFYDKKVETINISGGIDITGKASYVTTNTSNPVGDFTQNVFNSVASVAGKQVQEIIFPPKKTPSLNEELLSDPVTQIIGSVISTIISNSISAATKSWTASWGKTDSKIKTIDINLSGNIDLDGIITENTPPPVIPIQNILVPGADPTTSILLPIYENEIGVWNIKKNKPVQIGSYTYPSLENYSHLPTNENDYPVIGDMCEYICVKTPIYTKDDIVLNEAIINKIEKYEVSSTIFYKATQANNVIDDTTSVNNVWLTNGTKYYLINKEQNYQINRPYWLLINSDNFQRYGTSSFYLDEKNFKFVTKVTLLLYPKPPYNTDVISLTRTYDCKTEVFTSPSHGRVLLGTYN